MTNGMKIMAVLRNLILMYILTAACLLLLSFGVYKLELSEAVVGIFVIVIYLAVTFLGGLLTGKKVKEKKFLWGALFGFLYILIVMLASLVMHKEFDVMSTKAVTSMVLCVCGGLLGGMFS